ncbi:NAD-dependent epimerase/dehydratase family protein [Lutispora thermophila]|mgnify:CR=1 FL=1|uniref:dTDP-glucose 4,6-dehydratase n=1 Tax=Lutispora thermophila DSM 19022 TaxID=1122184 RepID=A0A1M6CQN4_9FIRM|nr:NAD-dependent epimerase/dehydratase family protein [Lutispora thermophila]SHI63048.1 dTDP-glucose 4,6-dehydratase [Lutispora thermophila DSM 19022]
MKSLEVIYKDIEKIYINTKNCIGDKGGRTWIITGSGGFIGSYFLDFIDYCNKYVFSTPDKVICIDNYRTSSINRIMHLTDNDNFLFLDKDISKPIEITHDVDYIVHAASIASPSFYRKYPIETIEANVWGLKNLLDIAKSKSIKSMLYLSSSEIYGDPDSANIPTDEAYNGNVSCVGPRACYDESKRLGETLCINYWKQYDVPIKIVRPFNVYGPGLRIDDKRVISDFFKGALYDKKIEILSDGRPTRSFCYISDAVTGFIKVLMSEYNGEAFNIGNDEQEISMKQLAEKVAEVVGNTTIIYDKSNDKDYLIDNPRRRCPDLRKARNLLNYNPSVNLETGLKRLLAWYSDTYKMTLY